MSTVAVVAHARKSFGGVGNAGHPEQSPFVRVTAGRKFRIQFAREIPYELDGGARRAVRDLRIKVHPRSVTVCVPA